jgi:glycosyltransferase involved in cell wall biosynthesis
VLLDAFAKVRAANPAARLTMIGDGDERQALEAQAASLGIADAVEFAGFRTQTEVRSAMARADMLVLASFAEGVPVVLMEAMASGIPVVAPQVAGVGELVENGVSGYIAPAGDAQTYAARMSALFADPELRARMGAAGRAKVAAQFDIDGETAWLHCLIDGAAAGSMPIGLRPTP